MARATESWINDTILGERYSAVRYIYAIPYPYSMGQSKSNKKKKEKKRIERKRILCVEEASLNARRIALRDGIARQRPFAITGRGSFFARSGGRTLRSLLLITLSDTVRRTYIPSYTSGVYRSVTIYHWSAYIAILEQAYRQYGRHVRAGRNERNELSLRIENCRANLPKPIVTRTFKLHEIIFYGVQYGT